MRIVCYANGGELALAPLRALAEVHEIVAVVRPARTASWMRRAAGALGRAVGLRRWDPLDLWLGHAGLPIVTLGVGEDERLANVLRDLRPDLACISTFPRLLSASVLEVPRFGTFNLHPSLLPRHRGPAPYFWLYYHNDRDTGVTVHRAGARADAGPVVLQEAFPLPRGWPVDLLHAESARRGAALLCRAVAAVMAGKSVEAPQDEAAVTLAPRVRPGSARIDFVNWDVERTWHFLAGLFPRYREPLADLRGRRVIYNAVLGFERGPVARVAGSLESSDRGWRLWCRDGYVKLGNRTT